MGASDDLVRRAGKREGDPDRRFSTARTSVLGVAVVLLLLGFRLIAVGASPGPYPVGAGVLLLLLGICWKRLPGTSAGATRPERAEWDRGERRLEREVLNSVVVYLLLYVLVAIALVLTGHWISLLVMCGLALVAGLLVRGLSRSGNRPRGRPSRPRRGSRAGPDPNA